MDCPKCGWEMRLVDRHNYENLKDALYRCICGTTHLVIDNVSLEDDEEVRQLLTHH